jgi:hypothetical protein
MRALWLTVGWMCLAAPVALAQTKLSGAGQCAKRDPEHKLDVGDRPQHAFSISRSKCTWSRPFEIAGVEAKGGTAVQFDEVSAKGSRFHGYYLDTMANGDTAHYRYQGTATLNEGMPPSTEWQWTLRGTGKLKGVKGKGTCKGTASPDGMGTWECVGEYKLEPKGARSQ